MLPDFRVRQRDYLLEIAAGLSGELDLKTLLERILSVSIEMLAGQAGLIALRSDTLGWKIQTSVGIAPAFLRAITPLLADIPSSVESVEAEIPEINRLLDHMTFAASMGFLTGVGLPLTSLQKVVGVIYIFRSYLGIFSKTDKSLLRSFANQAAVAVQNAQLYKQVTQEKQRMEALLNNAGDGILILGSDHKIQTCNTSFSRLYGLDSNKIQGMDHDQIIQWNGPTQGVTLEQAEAGGWPLTPHALLYVEGDLKRQNNQVPLPIGITYAPLLSEEGTLQNIIATIRDITRFREAEELKSTFISIISHELKTPVALIKGYVSTLRRDDAKWDRKVVNESLQVIEEEADRLTGLIENMLDASRLQAGGVSLKQSDILLPDMVSRLIKRFQTQTSKHTIVMDFPEDFPVILADETRIQQVISNLISNAIKYSPGGEIRISGQVRPDRVIISVSDEGPGISPNDIPHVFDRFYRSPEMARATKGAGLGLYLSRSIIEAHGGKIWVDPAPQGARFYFTLPRSIN
ncbi:MAG: PAS domain-containing protein [Chloroflexi bacterium]|nr:PAS domain-containing protein [Chloroflexota bacterium]